MGRWLIVFMLALALIGWFSPFLRRIGLGRLPGDIHFVRAVAWLLEREELSGAINVCAPEPLPQSAFARTLREACGAAFGLPATGWMLELGALVLRTDTELLLKSRRVVPGRLLGAGFTFEFPTWSAAARDLVERRRGRGGARSAALATR